MNASKSPSQIFNEAVIAARNGDDKKLDEIGWERIEYCDEVEYVFNHPSDLQRFAMLDNANRLISQAGLLIDLATDYDGDNSYTISEENVCDFRFIFKAFQEISTMTDSEIIEQEYVPIPCNFPLY